MPNHQGRQGVQSAASETDQTPSEILEESLWFIAETGEDITPHFFGRLFARYPEQKQAFHHYDSTCGTMVNEMLESLLALAAHEEWVERSTQSLVIAHRCYGAITLPQYADSIDMLIDTLAELAADRWSDRHDKAWRAQANSLKAIVERAY